MNSILKTIFVASTFFLFAFSCSETSADSDTNNDNGQNEEPAPNGEKEWQLVWADEFETEELDADKWSFQYGTGRDEGLTGWGNNELQYYTDREENIFIEDDMLHIVAREENFEGMNYTSARIRSIDKGDWQYGRFEIRAKLPEGQGIWPAIWMLPTNEVFGIWPNSGEIDIMELVGHEPETIHGTVHYGFNNENQYDHQFTGDSYTLEEGKFSDGFHVFSIEWERNQIKWFMDGDHFFTVTQSDLSPYIYPFNYEFHMLINLAVGGNWPGNPDDTTEFPQKMIVDYVRVYQFK